MKNLLLTVACFMLFNSLVFGQTKEMTLQDCIETAMLNNLQVKQGRAMVQIGENAVKQSKRTLLPNLNFNTNYYLNYGRSLDYSTYQFVNQTLQSNTYNLSSQLSLYQGGIKGNTIKQAGYDLERSKLEQESLIENIKLYVITAYLQVLFAEEQQKIAEQQEAIAEKQYSDAKKLVNAGTIPEGNLLSLEAQLAADAVQVANTQNAVELAYLDLKNLMQISHLENIKIVYADIQSMQNLLEADIPDEQTVIDAALLTQPGIKKFAYQLKSNALAVKIAQGAALPSVFVGGSLGTSYSNAEGFDITGPVPPDPFGTQIGNNFNGGLGLSVTIPIFNNGQMLLNKQNAMLNYLTTEVAQQSAINDLKKSVVQAVTNCKAARVSYNAALKSYDAAIKSFEFEQKKFNAGQSNSLNYTIAENTMRQAEITLLQAKYDFIFKRKVIDYYLGLPLNF